MRYILKMTWLIRINQHDVLTTKPPKIVVCVILPVNLEGDGRGYILINSPPPIHSWVYRELRAQLIPTCNVYYKFWNAHFLNGNKINSFDIYTLHRNK